MKSGAAKNLTFLLILMAMVASSQAAPGQSVGEATIDQVKACKPLGQVIGESRVCSKTRAKKNALQQAAALGATHVVWVQVNCVVMVGEKALARIFNCSPSTSLEDAFENYIAFDSKLASQTISAQEPPRIMTSGDLDADADDLQRRGYVLVGYAGVLGGKISLEIIREKAVSVGAGIVLFQSRDAGEDVEYQAITSYTRGGTGVAVSSAYISGAIGGTPLGVGGTGTSIITSPGSTRTQVIPFSQRQFETQVLFWRKLRPGPRGLFLGLIPSEFRERLSRNTGAFVIAVEDESPAFFANVVSGDIIIAVNDTEVRTPSEFSALVEREGSSALRLQVLRNMNMIEIQLKD